MGRRAWAIKLGSGGRCIPFCEQRQVVGLGWHMVDHGVLTSATQDDLWGHIRERCTWYGSSAAVSMARGQLWRFARECAVGDVVVYYDPTSKSAVFGRVTTPVVGRRSEDDGDPEVDIWFTRDVEIVRTIPILNLHGTVKGRLLGPRMSFWALRPADLVHRLADGGSETECDEQVEKAFRDLVDVVVQRSMALNDRDWEFVVAEYFRAQGAHVPGRVGGSQAVIDVEAQFPRGAIGVETWRLQVKRLTDQPVDWPMIVHDFERSGDCDRFGYVSVFGFTEEARQGADQEGIKLFEPRDFAMFLLSDRVGEHLRQRLGFPALVP